MRRLPSIRCRPRFSRFQPIPVILCLGLHLVTALSELRGAVYSPIGGAEVTPDGNGVGVTTEQAGESGVSAEFEPAVSVELDLNARQDAGLFFTVAFGPLGFKARLEALAGGGTMIDASSPGEGEGLIAFTDGSRLVRKDIPGPVRSELPIRSLRLRAHFDSSPAGRVLFALDVIAPSPSRFLFGDGSVRFAKAVRFYFILPDGSFFLRGLSVLTETATDFHLGLEAESGLLFDGLVHAAQGTGYPEVLQNGPYRLSDIGSSGEDGVSITDPRRGGVELFAWRARMSLPDGLPLGGRVTFTSRLLEHEGIFYYFTRKQDGIRFDAGWTTGATPNLTAEILRDGEIRYSTHSLAGLVFTDFEETPNGFPLGSVDITVENDETHWVGRDFRGRWETDEGAVVGDSLRIRVATGDVNGDGIIAILIGLIGTPTLEIHEESWRRGLRFGDMPALAHGEAQLSDTDDGLSISGLGSSADDGVEFPIETPYARSRHDFALEPALLAEPESGLGLSASQLASITDGTSNTMMFHVRRENALLPFIEQENIYRFRESSLLDGRLAADGAALGAAAEEEVDVEIAVFEGGKLRGAVNLRTGSNEELARVARTDVPITGARIGPDSLGFVLAASVDFALRDGSVLAGDEIRVRSRRTVEVEAQLGEVALFGARLEEIVIVSVDRIDPSPMSPAFRRADADGSGSVDITDAIVSLGHLFLGSRAPGCLDAADANDDGSFDISDPVVTLGYLFLGHRSPPSPGPTSCGVDPTEDGLGCERPGTCP